MHMVVGFLLASLLRKKRGVRSSLPSISGKLEVVHALPGRLRLRSSLLENLEDRTQKKIADEMVHIDGIRLTDINTQSGSLLIEYDVARIQDFIVHGIVVKLLGLETELDKSPSGWLTREIKLIGRSLNQQIHQSSRGVMDLRSSLMIGILILAMYRLFIQKDRSLPNGINLLWWTYVMAQRG